MIRSDSFMHGSGRGNKPQGGRWSETTIQLREGNTNSGLTTGHVKSHKEVV